VAALRAGFLKGETAEEAEKSGPNLYRLKAGSTVAA
jgi:hypothetical protein